MQSRIAKNGNEEMNKPNKERPAPKANTDKTDYEVVKWGNREFRIADLPPHVLHYLVQYGMNQSRGDAVAGFKKEHVTQGIPADESAAIFDKAYADRLAHILNGTIRTRVIGPRKVGIEKFMQEVAVDRIRAACNRPGKDGKKTKMPTGKVLADLVERLISTHGPAIRASAELRMSEAEQGIEGVF